LLKATANHRLDEIKRASEGGIRTLEARFEEQQKKVQLAQQKSGCACEKLKISQANTISQASTVVDAPLPRKPATNAPIPQPEIQTSENNSPPSRSPSATCPQTRAASLEKGPDAGLRSIRSEEFINPSTIAIRGDGGLTRRLRVERARYPFAHIVTSLRFSLKTAAVGRQRDVH